MINHVKRAARSSWDSLSDEHSAGANAAAIATGHLVSGVAAAFAALIVGGDILGTDSRLLSDNGRAQWALLVVAGIAWWLGRWMVTRAEFDQTQLASESTAGRGQQESGDK